MLLGVPTYDTSGCDRSDVVRVIFQGPLLDAGKSPDYIEPTDWPRSMQKVGKNEYLRDWRNIGATIYNHDFGDLPVGGVIPAEVL
jgi:hypothetical protein